ncbi:MAG: enoyl-CoA hydratase/isomerase family protein [bacterium]|nr:enoyl-CoA hydratase/isomerase family protein [bacterium]
MSFETLTVERKDAITYVWLDRPERRNALNTLALEEICALFTELQRDFETRVVVLGGRGKSFCAGADRRDPPGVARMSAASGASDRERRYASQLGRRACAAVLDLEAATIARVHGHAVGGGLALALACDLRIASDDAVFHIPEVDLGIPLAWGATPRLIQEIGASRARELILMCDQIQAVEAARLGVVHRAVPVAELDSAVDAWARRIAEKPEVAVHMTKTQFRAYSQSSPLGDATESDGDSLMSASRSAAARASFERGD